MFWYAIDSWGHTLTSKKNALLLIGKPNTTFADILYREGIGSALPR